VLKASFQAVKSTQPRASHTAVDAVIRSSVVGIDELASGLSHPCRITEKSLRKNQVSLILGSDLSEGFVPRAFEGWVIPRFSLPRFSPALFQLGCSRRGFSLLNDFFTRLKTIILPAFVALGLVACALLIFLRCRLLGETRRQ
jgi:hypothetical protein